MHPQAAYSFVCENLHKLTFKPNEISEGYDPNLQPQDCESFEALMDTYRKSLYLHQGHEDTLAIIMATLFSIKLNGPNLWAFIIGPPSSGKTTMTSTAASNHHYCLHLSKITGVYSGFRGQGDASLVAKFQNKTVVIKDFTVILSSTPQAIDQIFGDLRDLYDGHGATQFRNQQQGNYQNVKFNMLACVTDAIRKYSFTDLGERFLQVEIDSNYSADGTLGRYESSSSSIVSSAIRGLLQDLSMSDTKVDKLSDAKAMSWGFLDHLFDKLERDPSFMQSIAFQLDSNKEFKDYLEAWGTFITSARARIERNRSGDAIFRSRVEQSPRVVLQLTKLAVCLCYVLGVQAPDDRVRRIIRKVALDTSNSLNLEVLMAIAHCQNPNGMSGDELVRTVSISRTCCHQILTDYYELGILTKVTVSNNSGNRGRGIHYYRFSSVLDEVTKKIGIRTSPDKPKFRKPNPNLPDIAMLPDEVEAAYEEAELKGKKKLNRRI